MINVLEVHVAEIQQIIYHSMKYKVPLCINFLNGVIFEVSIYKMPQVDIHLIKVLKAGTSVHAGEWLAHTAAQSLNAMIDGT